MGGTHCLITKAIKADAMLHCKTDTTTLESQRLVSSHAENH